MTTLNAVLIPCDGDKPVQSVTYDDSDYRNLTALIFDGDRTGTFTSLQATGADGTVVSLWGDDEGLLRSDAHQRINARAMQLYAHLTGATIEDFMSPLVGDWVVLGGADDDGESLAVPGWVQDFPFTWASSIPKADS